MTAFLPSASRLNGVGYNTTEKIDLDTMTFIGASFECVGEGNILSLNSLTSPQGIADGDQIQMAETDDKGNVHMTIFEYWDGDGWVDPSSGDPIGDTIGFSLGQAAWYISTEAKSITTAGEVKKANHIHTFTDSMTIASSAFPSDFCPNSENVSWGCLDGDQIQTPWCDDRGNAHMNIFEYWDGDGWVDPSSGNVLEADFPVATTGKGFWFITSDPASSTFSEVSPLAE